MPEKKKHKRRPELENKKNERREWRKTKQGRRPVGGPEVEQDSEKREREMNEKIIETRGKLAKKREKGEENGEENKHKKKQKKCRRRIETINVENS